VLEYENSKANQCIEEHKGIVKHMDGTEEQKEREKVVQENNKDEKD